VDVRTINYHLKKIFSDSELQEDSVIRNFRITAAAGKSYNTKHYSLAADIAVGYKVNSDRTVQFRKWATTIIGEFTIEGYAMDEERLKSGGSIITDQYFEEISARYCNTTVAPALRRVAWSLWWQRGSFSIQRVQQPRKDGRARLFNALYLSALRLELATYCSVMLLATHPRAAHRTVQSKQPAFAMKSAR